MQEWAESAWIAISIIICSAIVSVAVVLNDMGRNIVNEVQEDRRATAAMQEYRKTHQWDNTDVYPQDVVSLVLETRGQPPVFVFDSNPSFSVDPVLGKPNPQLSEVINRANSLGAKKWYRDNIVYTYNASGAVINITDNSVYSTAFSAASVTSSLSLDKMYKSFVSTDSNGAVACFWLYRK
jgi:hypothetical protein